MALAWLVPVLILCSTGLVSAATTLASPVASLREKHASLEPAFRQNQFNQPLVIASVESRNRVQGDIYAVIRYPFAVVDTGLRNADHWCDVIFLHINTQYCHAQADPSGTTLKVNIGKKEFENLADSARIELSYRVAATTPDYFEVTLNAPDGPLGTSDYRIRLEAVALPDLQTFLHLSYSYTMSFAGRLAMQTYLGTIGRNKVGFTVTGTRTDGTADYIGGVRGLVERNTMRYYLAIDSFLEAFGALPEARFEQRLHNWFTSVEHYPRQLHEMDREEYLGTKHAEDLRQRSVP